MNQCWNIVYWTLRNKLWWNLNRNAYIFIQENAFENVSKMAAILSRHQCVKEWGLLFLYNCCHTKPYARSWLAQVTTELWRPPLPLWHQYISVITSYTGGSKGERKKAHSGKTKHFITSLNNVLSNMASLKTSASFHYFLSGVYGLTGSHFSIKMLFART